MNGIKMNDLSFLKKGDICRFNAEGEHFLWSAHRIGSNDSSRSPRFNRNVTHNAGVIHSTSIVEQLYWTDCLPVNVHVSMVQHKDDKVFTFGRQSLVVVVEHYDPRLGISNRQLSTNTVAGYLLGHNDAPRIRFARGQLTKLSPLELLALSSALDEITV